ncbi:type I restriction endonuclease subunit R [Nostoc sp. LEGE 12450]|uniref:type I restriction endonuclease subunit R n=1 Tax=Nostoc sp. LEGE 12450 TaxID=1828643 RepID=UPI00187E4107|nr:HsdR family type I site-specific deoxyribonuclease [Nostoc sp. LEGE 12450]MBE8989437.1 HsdR family type I site-specific deoxyribonuclease [Nostoc sp. LEGE 12450]
MNKGPEYTLGEKPCIDALVKFGFTWLQPQQNQTVRDTLNQVILRDIFIAAIQRINNIPEEVARATYQDMLAVNDNEQWTNLLRGNYSRNVPGEATKKTICLIDFLYPENNTFTATNQLYVKSQNSRKPDIVIFINGIPLVVIEAKKPFIAKDKTGEAFEQIKQYERDIPRLFYSNAFNIITDGVNVLYGATDAASAYWGAWKEEAVTEGINFSNKLEKQLWYLLEPSRLLDILAHFIVFEKREQKVTKKICRYQQFRAVNKIVDRVLAPLKPNPSLPERKYRKGLIWHTQGSGKSLTMVFATLKLKTHKTIDSPSLENPNILILTDRIDLDTQIANTFLACGLPNPTRITSGDELQKAINSNPVGLTLLSTIFKFNESTKQALNSNNWIILVDECHRTQERDLGTFLEKTLVHACFIGFTGTPIQNTDQDTYENFSLPGEGYLDRYSIDDAVADGATVPIRYTSRKAEWEVDEKRLDILFDNWFANEPEEVVNKIKARGVKVEDLVKHRQRIELLAYDIWTHFSLHAAPEGFKAQIVAIDREAIILYKKALDKIISKSLTKQGFDPETATAWAEAMSVPIYSSNQEDGKPSEDKYINTLRKDLRKYALDKDGELAATNRFTGDDVEYEAKVQRGEVPPVHFLIICNKLLTGFDAPRESVMYLDNPLKEHNLLQAIARTNRVYGDHKEFGLIVDYIGVTKNLTEALSTYRQADVKNAMRDLEVERNQLKAAHAEVMKFLKPIPRNTGDIRQEYDALIQHLGTEDRWYDFHRQARPFIKAYDALSPDPFILDYRTDLKWVAGFLPLGTLTFEKRESNLSRDVSAKIREMLNEHLDITGITTLCKLHDITDPDFWKDFTSNRPEPEIKTAAVRKSAELRKIMQQKVDENPLYYDTFSERVLEVLRQFEQGQLEAAATLKQYEQILREMQTAEQAYKKTSLNQQAYGVLKILEAFLPANQDEDNSSKQSSSNSATSDNELSPLEKAAQEIDALYSSDETAPHGWYLKEQLRKELRQKVRALVFNSKLENWKDIPSKVDEYALKHYSKT